MILVCLPLNIQPTGENTNVPHPRTFSLILNYTGAHSPKIHREAVALSYTWAGHRSQTGLKNGSCLQLFSHGLWSCAGQSELGTSKSETLRVCSFSSRKFSLSEFTSRKLPPQRNLCHPRCSRKSTGHRPRKQPQTRSPGGLDFRKFAVLLLTQTVSFSPFGDFQVALRAAVTRQVQIRGNGYPDSECWRGEEAS